MNIFLSYEGTTGTFVTNDNPPGADDGGKGAMVVSLFGFNGRVLPRPAPFGGWSDQFLHVIYILLTNSSALSCSLVLTFLKETCLFPLVLLVVESLFIHPLLTVLRSTTPRIS